MKYLFAVILFCSQAFASGKITFQTSFHPKVKDYGHQLAFVMHQPFSKKFAYVGWTGVGQRPPEVADTVDYFATKHDLEYYCGRVTFAFGVGANYGGDEIRPADLKEADYNVHAKIAFRLW